MSNRCSNILDSNSLGSIIVKSIVQCKNITSISSLYPSLCAMTEFPEILSRCNSCVWCYHKCVSIVKYFTTLALHILVLCDTFTSYDTVSLACILCAYLRIRTYPIFGRETVTVYISNLVRHSTDMLNRLYKTVGAQDTAWCCLYLQYSRYIQQLKLSVVNPHKCHCQ